MFLVSHKFEKLAIIVKEHIILSFEQEDTECRHHIIGLKSYFLCFIFVCIQIILPISLLRFWTLIVLIPLLSMGGPESSQNASKIS